MKVLIKGAGDLASGIACRLFRCGHDIVMTDIAVPTTVRRTVAFSPAIYEGKASVEEIQGIRCDSMEEVEKALQQRMVAVVEDPECRIATSWRPDVLVDAIIAKKNLGTHITDARTVIGVGPGFMAGVDCHCVVETKRGHNLGRCIWHGSAAPNTGIPGNIGGYDKERIIRASADGVFRAVSAIGDVVEKGQIVAMVDDVPVYALIPGVVRGILQDGVLVRKGMKAGDIDPRCAVEHCYTVSDKATAVAGGVLEAIYSHGVRSGEKVLVMLAAGNSQRFHGNKLLHYFRGKPLYCHLADQIDALPSGVFSQKIMVTQYEEIEEDMKRRGFDVVKNEQPELGISHSIQLAVGHVKNPEAAICFCVCDQPYLKGETLVRLLDNWEKSGKGLACLSYEEELGNPAVFSSYYKKELLALSGDQGGKKVIRRHLEDLFTWEVDDKKELVDIDERDGLTASL